MTLLQITEGVFIEQASKGISKLGGMDIDKLMYKKLTEDMPDSSMWTDADRGSVMLEIEKAKIRLSSEEETSVPFPRASARVSLDEG